MTASSETESSPAEVAALRHRLSGLTRLLETTKRLAAETDLNRLLQLITDEACSALHCDRASLFLFDPHTEELFTKVVTELELREIRLPLDQGIVGWVGLYRQVVHVPDPAGDPRWDPSVDRRTGFTTRNMLTAPIMSPHDDRLLGVIQLLNKADGPFDSNDEELLLAFASHAAVALERAEFLAEQARTREFESSLEIARQVQISFLPRELPPISGYAAASSWHPAQGVAGDYYDVIPVPDGRLALVIGDVAGHGIGPSLIMASARAMLHVLARTCSAPGRMLSLLSESIFPDLPDGRFITMLLGALDPREHTFTFANAGHAPAFHLSRRTGEVRHLEPSTFPLGVMVTPIQEAAEPVRIEPGDVLVLATDGAIETANPSGEMFGIDRLVDLVRQYQHLPAGEIVLKIETTLRAFYDTQPPHDDITVFVLERKRHA